MRTAAFMVGTCVLAVGLRAGAETVRPISNRDMRATMSAHLADLESCLTVDHGVASGSLQVIITIDKEGHVSRTRIGHASDNAAIDQCVASAIETFTFPKPTNGKTFVSVYPFHFAAAKEPEVATLTEGQIETAVATKDKAMWACYRRAKRADLVAQLDLVVTVRGDGHVTDVRLLDSTSAMPDFDACIVAQMKSVTFPPPSDGAPTSFIFPVSFEP